MNPINQAVYEDVYYVEAGQKKGMSPIAIRPEIKKGSIEWDDTSGWTSLKIREIEVEQEASESPQKIIVKTEKGEKIVLWKLNLELYNDKVRKWVYNQPEFKTELDLKNHYLNSSFHQY